jgi:hypothetical protein
MCRMEGGLYICRLQKPSGPNLLDELLNDYMISGVLGLATPCI